MNKSTKSVDLCVLTREETGGREGPLCFIRRGRGSESELDFKVFLMSSSVFLWPVANAELTLTLAQTAAHHVVSSGCPQTR